MRIDLWMTDVVTVVVGHGSGIRHFFPTDGSQPCPPHTWTVTTACPPSTYASGLFYCRHVATGRQACVGRADVTHVRIDASTTVTKCPPTDGP